MTGEEGLLRFEKAAKALREGRIADLEALLPELLPSEQELMQRRITKIRLAP